MTDVLVVISYCNVNISRELFISAVLGIVFFTSQGYFFESTLFLQGTQVSIERM